MIDEIFYYIVNIVDSYKNKCTVFIKQEKLSNRGDVWVYTFIAFNKCNLKKNINQKALILRLLFTVTVYAEISDNIKIEKDMYGHPLNHEGLWWRVRQLLSRSQFSKLNRLANLKYKIRTLK